MLKDSCYGVDLQVEKPRPNASFRIYLIPIPKQYSTTKQECDFYEKCLEKLSDPKLAEYIDDSEPWVHMGSSACRRKLTGSDKYCTALCMTFKLGSFFTAEMAEEYKRQMEVA